MTVSSRVQFFLVAVPGLEAIIGCLPVWPEIFVEDLPKKNVSCANSGMESCREPVCACTRQDEADLEVAYQSVHLFETARFSKLKN
jgi:hypothetical protein